MKNKLMVNVEGSQVEFEFENLTNQFKFLKIIKEGGKIFQNFEKKLGNMDTLSFSERLSIMEFLGTEVLVNCTSHDFKSQEKIENFFQNDYNAYAELVGLVTGFMTDNFQKNQL